MYQFIKTIFQKLFSQETLLFIWFLIVYFAYIYFHNYHLAFVPILIVGLITIGSWKFFIKKQLKPNFTINIERPLWQYALFILFIILNLAFILRFFGNLATEQLNLFSFLVTEINVFNQIIIKSAFLIILTLLTASLGKKTLNWFKFNFDTKQEELFFSIGIGFLILNYLTFFLTALGWLYFWPSWFLILTLVILSWKEIINWLKTFLESNFCFRLTANLKDQQTQHNLIWLLIIIFFIIGFFATFRFFPTEYDDLDTYFSVPKLYSYYHHLVPFYNSPSAPSGGIVMTFYALINTTLAPHFVFHLSWLFLILLLSTLYLFTKKFFSQQIAIITLLLAASTPWNSFFIATQKIDFLFTFISILALFALFDWLKNTESKWLYLAAVFLGFSLAIKINGVFLTISVGFVLLYLFGKKTITLWQTTKWGIIVSLFFAPILMLNLYYYQNPFPSFADFSFKTKTEKIFSSDKKVTMYDIYNQTNFAKQRSKELTLLGRQNNLTESKIFNFFWLFWNITINQRGVNLLYLEVGPYLLIFLPFFIFKFFRNKHYQNKNLLCLSFISTIFMILWFWRGAERPWYGMAIFYLLFIFSAIILNETKTKKYLTIIYSFVILFSVQVIISLFCITINNLPNTILNSPTILQNIYNDTSLFKMSNFINQKIINKNDQTLILAFMRSDMAYVPKNDKLIIQDARSVYWGKILTETNSLTEIKNILVNQNITHVLYSTNFKNHLYYLINKESNNNYYHILKEITVFEQFKDQYLTSIYCTAENLCIYKIKD